jgi:histidine ammonia-lyase
MDGRLISTSGFHAVEPAARMDAMEAAFVHAAEVVVQRRGRLLDERFSGLPAQLSPDPGPRCGLVVVHKRAVGTLHCLRSMLGPVTGGFVETSAGQEDAMTFAWEAAMQLDAILEGVRELIACELLAIRQAWGLRQHVPRGPLAIVQSELNDLVAFVDEDRPLGPDLSALIDAL